MDPYKAQRLYEKDIYTWPAFEEMHYVFSIVQSFYVCLTRRDITRVFYPSDRSFILFTAGTAGSDSSNSRLISSV
jgi:hypothetical protein